MTVWGISDPARFDERLPTISITHDRLRPVELAKASAGHGSRFALATSLPSVCKNKQTDQLLDTIREWERLRMAGSFSAEQRERLRDSTNEFHLEKIDKHAYQLYPYQKSPLLTYEETMRQPGEPTASAWEYTSARKKQPLQFTLEVVGTPAPSNMLRWTSITTAASKFRRNSPSGKPWFATERIGCAL